ncbi:MAG: hypothetical protein JWL65_1324 [Gammaproteobacteria bacterium]|nr:hypothetical protein [Gammaproteobacteria bacterium]
MLEYADARVCRCQSALGSRTGMWPLRRQYSSIDRAAELTPISYEVKLGIGINTLILKRKLSVVSMMDWADRRCATRASLPRRKCSPSCGWCGRGRGFSALARAWSADGSPAHRCCGCWPAGCGPAPARRGCAWGSRARAGKSGGGLSRQPMFPTGHIESRETTAGHYPEQMSSSLGLGWTTLTGSAGRSKAGSGTGSSLLLLGAALGTVYIVLGILYESSRMTPTKATQAAIQTACLRNRPE